MREMWNKYKILFGIEIIVLFFLLLGCFQKERLIWADEDIVLTEENILYEGGEFSVKPGVYQIRVSVSDAVTGQVRCSVRTNNNPFRAVRCNDVVLTNGSAFLESEIYVVGSADGLYAECSTDGQPVRIENIEIYRTNLGNRIGVFLFVLLFAGLNCMLYFRERILSQSISKEKQFAFWSLSACIIITLFPYMTDYIGYAPQVMKLCERIKQLSENPEVVWAAEDLFLAFPVLFRKIGFSLMTSYKMNILVITTVTTVVIYYFLSWCIKKETAALLGTVVYILAPRRIVSVYEWGSIGVMLLSGEMRDGAAWQSGIVWSILLIWMKTIAVVGFYLWLEKKADAKLKWWIVFGLVLVFVGEAVYCVNNIAYTYAPVWIYS